jgi:hypothetical protein
VSHCLRRDGEHEKARQELAQGALKEKLALLNKLVVSCRHLLCSASDSVLRLSCFASRFVVRVEAPKKLPQELAEGALKEKLALLNTLVVSFCVVHVTYLLLCVTLLE